METKLFDNTCITLDGRMDEPVWDEVKEYTDFKKKKVNGGGLAEVQTSFKIIPCADRIFVGIKCIEPDMEYVAKVNPSLGIWTSDHVEIFLSPSHNYYDFYQFAVSFDGQAEQRFYSEAGYIQPDPYAPEWHYGVYKGEGFWSVEMELPLTAFYMTTNQVWSDKWLVNTFRVRTFWKNDAHERISSSWCQLDKKATESILFRTMDGFPMRETRDDVRILQASAEMQKQTKAGYVGVLSLKAECPESTTYEFISDHTEPVTVELKAGTNTFSIPCVFPACERYKLPLELKRLSDGVSFKRYYPVRVSYEPIRLELTKPEYRSNFYPGQDYSQIAGKVICAEAVTLKLEGPGIETQIITLNADGSFCFSTASFEIGEAVLTALAADNTLVKKIRRLAPTERMMTWVSGGKFIVNGEPRFTRKIHAEGWRGGEALRIKYEKDNLHNTPEVRKQLEHIEPDRILKKLGMPVRETTMDIKPSQAVFDDIDAQIEKNKDRDFAVYYLSNEPECRAVSPVYLKYLYDYLVEKDPYHIVQIDSRSVDTYVDAADAFEVHPYINPYTDDDGNRVLSRPFETLGKYVDAMTQLNRPDKSIGFSGTSFAGVRAKKDPYPTLDEIICNCWSCLVRGPKTMRVYAYHDLLDRASVYEGTRYVFSTVEALEQLLLHANRTTLMKNSELEACLWELGQEKLFAIVNFSQKNQTITLNELSGIWHHFRHNETLTGPIFSLKPFGVLVGTNVVKDAGYPTYQEIAALVEKQEAARKSNQSLLFERQSEISATASAGVTWLGKLFDGVKDNYSWSQKKGNDKFYEIDISKIKPTFQKAVISGYNLDALEIKVKIGECYIAPIAQTQAAEFSKTFLLQEPITADAIRLEFNKPDGVMVELYEIEIFK